MMKGGSSTTSAADMLAKFTSKKIGTTSGASGSHNGIGDQRSQPMQPLADRLQQLPWLKNKLRLNHDVAVNGKLDPRQLLIVLPIHNHVISNEIIWKTWIEDCKSQGYLVTLCLLDIIDIPAASSELLFTEWITANHFPIKTIESSSSDAQLNYKLLSATFEMLSNIMNGVDGYQHLTSIDRFLVATGSTGRLIPIATPKETFEALESNQRSWLNLIYNFPNESKAFTGIDQSIIPFKNLRKVDPTGIILLRQHVKLLLGIFAEVGEDTTALWKFNSNPEASYYATMLGLLGTFNLASMSSVSCEVICKPAVYCHYTTAVGDDRAQETVFALLTLPMMQEFRRSGALFAKHVLVHPSEEQAMLADWRHLVFEEKYQCKDYILRLGGAPVDFNREATILGSEEEEEEEDLPAQKKTKFDRSRYSTKLVINSNRKYIGCLAVLLKSILESDFVNHPSASTEDIIVSISQSEAGSKPMLQSIESLTGGAIKSDCQVVVVHSTLNSFDWTAKQMLHTHQHHARVRADYYLYLLDTCKVDKLFWRKVLAQVPVYPQDANRETIRITTKPHSSISIFGRGVVRNYRDNFARPISKTDGLILEMLEKPIFYPDGYVLHGITRFGEVSRLAVRSRMGSADWYGTGINRDLYHYLDIGVTKAIAPAGVFRNDIHMSVTNNHKL